MMIAFFKDHTYGCDSGMDHSRFLKGWLMHLRFSSETPKDHTSILATGAFSEGIAEVFQILLRETQILPKF
jgi:hypothetical protein